MKNGGWVRWRHWTESGLVAFGQMPIRDVGRELQKFEAEAIKVLKETGADHVLYGVKEYDSDGDLDTVRFYLEPTVGAGVRGSRCEEQRRDDGLCRT